jgi:hypothetical protein
MPIERLPYVSTHAAGLCAYVRLQAVAHPQLICNLQLYPNKRCYTARGFHTGWCFLSAHPLSVFQDPSWNLTLRKVLVTLLAVCHVLLSCAGTQKIADAVNGTLKALGMKSGATGSAAGVVSILAFFAMLFVLAF